MTDTHSEIAEEDTQPVSHVEVAIGLFLDTADKTLKKFGGVKAGYFFGLTRN